MPSDRRLSVVIGTFNRVELIKRAVDSVIRETSTPVRVYVADAGSTDGTIEYLRSIASDAIIPVLAGRKLGQAKAYNDVFRVIDTPYVAWLSDDNEVVDNGLDVAVRILDREPRIGMVALKVRDLRGRFADAPYIGGISEIGILNVNQGLLRTDVLRDVGYFSETMGFYGIDPDLTAKVLLQGHDVVYVKQIALHHYRDWAEDPNSAAYVALKANQQRSLVLYHKKYGSLLKTNILWQSKRAAWTWLRARLGRRFQINSAARFFGAVPRDWNNIFMSRYISIFDGIIHRHKNYHLRQRIRRGRTAPDIPDEPAAI